VYYNVLASNIEINTELKKKCYKINRLKILETKVYI